MNAITFQPLTHNTCSTALVTYNFYVCNTTVTYNTVEVSQDVFANYYQLDKPHTTALRIFCNNTEAGFCILRPYNAGKEAYCHTYEISVYLDRAFCGQGIGTAAVTHIESIAQQLGAAVIMASMSADNDTSRHLFESCGYERCGHFKKVGKKFGKFLDLYYYQKLLTENIIDS